MPKGHRNQYPKDISIVLEISDEATENPWLQKAAGILI
jgi:hypothetical protein